MELDGDVPRDADAVRGVSGIIEEAGAIEVGDGPFIKPSLYARAVAADAEAVP